MKQSGNGRVVDLTEYEKQKSPPILLLQDISKPKTYLLCELPPGTHLPEDIIGRTVEYESEGNPAAEADNPFFTRRKNKIGTASLPKIKLRKLEVVKEDGRDSKISPA